MHVQTFKRLTATLVLLNCALLAVPWVSGNAVTFILANISAVFTILFLCEVQQLRLAPSS